MAKNDQSRVVVKNDSENPVPTEVIAESIVAISQGIKKLRAGRLNDRALVLLIHDAVQGIGKREIKIILDALDDLERLFLKKKA